MTIPSWYSRDDDQKVCIPVYGSHNEYCCLSWGPDEFCSEVLKRATKGEYTGAYDTVRFYHSEDSEEASITCHIYEVFCCDTGNKYMLISLYEFTDEGCLDAAICLKHNFLGALSFMKEHFLPFGKVCDIKWGF